MQANPEDAVFSQNGFHFAVRNQNSIEKWDLRSGEVVGKFEVKGKLTNFGYSRRGNCLMVLVDGVVKCLTAKDDTTLSQDYHWDVTYSVDDFAYCSIIQS